jgi:hypothetical protein
MKVYLKCWRGSQLLANYEFTVPASQAALPVLDRSALIAEAKSNLTTERLAFRPYDGIRFVIIGWDLTATSPADPSTVPGKQDNQHDANESHDFGQRQPTQDAEYDALDHGMIRLETATCAIQSTQPPP